MLCAPCGQVPESCSLGCSQALRLKTEGKEACPGLTPLMQQATIPAEPPDHTPGQPWVREEEKGLGACRRS